MQSSISNDWPARLARAREDEAAAILEELVAEAVRARASDLHLHQGSTGALVHLRMDGLLVPVGTTPEPVASRLIGRIKFLARLRTYQESLPQDGRIPGKEVGSPCDLRVATYPTVTGEKVVLRLFGQAAGLALEDLGLCEAAEQALIGALRQQAGLVLLTGPAGSGKTTTIYASLRWLANQSSRHIITVEDPVEQILPGIMQTEVNELRGLTFAKAGRHLLRLDPEVLVIGEIRDEETAMVAVRGALTGHLVISTLHAGSCQAVLERLWLLCPDRAAVLSALELVINQRLLRRLCSDCQGRGCVACWHTGYRGRVPVVEWIRLEPLQRQRLRAEGAAAFVPAETLTHASERWVAQGLTSVAEIGRVLGP